MLLVHPPVTKPSEPPAGPARLSGALSFHGIEHHILDANLEGLLAVMSGPTSKSDTWTKRAVRDRTRSLNALRSLHGYTDISRYKTAVANLHRLLQVCGSPGVSRLTFADYGDRRLSPLRSTDLLEIAEHPEKSPFYPYFKGRLPVLIEQSGTAFAGFSLNYLSQALSAFAMIGCVKKMFPGIKVVLGGSLLTSWMRRAAWRNQFNGLVDHAIGGPGEGPLLSLVGKKTDPNLSAPCSPSYKLFPLEDYLAPGLILPYSSSSGCYWGKCRFCPERAEGNAYSQIPPINAANELRELAARTGPLLIHLTDNAVSPALMESLCRTPPGVPWYGFARITRHLADPDFCMALKQSGCVMLKLGLESGSRRVLDSMHKGNSLEWSSAALKSLKRAGIGTYVYLLFGTPWETVAEARETLDFTVRHARYIDFLNVAVFNLPANSPETAKLEVRNFYDGDLSLCTDFIHPQGWDRRQVRHFLDREFRRQPAVRAIARSHPPVFGSNHAPLFLMGNDRGVRPS
ncbi:B12-binding domain-containing radical SAM protein [Syntrophorhabdus aromaticivorans]|nr:radical SAM protein [Syntrophorhabdus aromaticivorans]